MNRSFDTDLKQSGTIADISNVKRSAPTLPSARPVADAAVVQAAVETERAHTRAWLHDSVLQVLEYIASGGYADEPDAVALSRVAADAAAELRAYVEGETAQEAAAGHGELCERLCIVVAEERILADHEIGLIFGEQERELTGLPAEQIAAATAEALRNTRKHAGATRALVTCDVVDGAVTVIVSDDGVGFAVGRVRSAGAGLRESIVGRLAREGGSAAIRSRPGHGTRVTLRLPLDAHADAEPGRAA